MGELLGGGPFAVDLDAFPLVRVGSSAPSSLHSRAEARASTWAASDLASFFACTDRAISRRARFVLLHDARGMPWLDETQQREFRNELARRRPWIDRYLLAYAGVTQSPLQRGLLTALAWSSQLAVPVRIFVSEQDARSYLLEAYARVGPRKRRPDAGRRVPAARARGTG